MEEQVVYTKAAPARLFDLPETPEQLAIDCAKLKTLAQTIQDKRHTMCVPAQPDDYDLLLTRIYHTAAAVIPTLLAERDLLQQQVEEAKQEKAKVVSYVQSLQNAFKDNPLALWAAKKLAESNGITWDFATPQKENQP